MCDCYDGLVGDDEHGPLWCKNCLRGLESAMSEVATKATHFEEMQHRFEERGDSFRANCAQNCVITLVGEYGHLRALYDAMVPDPALAWVPQPPQVREQVAALAVLKVAR